MLNGILPFKYIGSKSNATFKDGVIYDRRNKPYYGSAKYKGWKEICTNNRSVCVVLFESDEYKECLKKEREYHIQNDVAINPIFFNQSIAAVNNFTNPKYGSFKHKDHHQKIVRLPTDHPLVLDGTYVGVTKYNKSSRVNQQGIGRYKHTISGEYCKLPTNHPLVLDGTYVGITKGRIVSEEERNKRRGHKGWSKISDDTKNELSRKRSLYAKNNIEAITTRLVDSTKNTIVFKNVNTGKRKRFPKNFSSPEWIPNHQARDKDKAFPKESCTKCGLIATKQNIRKYHNDKCKKNKVD